MSLLRDGIEDVRAFVLPDSIEANGDFVGISRSALVTWRSSLEQRLFQVYVNGQLAGVTLDSQQRKLVVQVPSSFESAVHCEVVSVEPKDADTSFADRIDPAASTGARVKLVLLRSQDLPTGATVNIYFDNGTGDVDYTERFNTSPIPIWPCPHDKAGFGLAQFGHGDLGYDSAAAVGYGKGCFGHGHFGLDADALEWTSPALSLGRYRFGTRVTDARGNESLTTETDAIAVTPGARPVARLDLGQFNEATGQLTLSLSDQP